MVFKCLRGDVKYIVQILLPSTTFLTDRIRILLRQEIFLDLKKHLQMIGLYRF